MEGLIHSTESFGSLDGPGIRFIVFLKGCPFRCLYCHNPDTWAGKGGEFRSSDSLLSQALRYRSYWGKEGGITVSGGEPLLQLDFLTEFFSKAKEKGISACVDTAAGPFTREEPFFSHFEKLLPLTDLFLVDIKEINPERHKALTGKENANVLDFLRFLDEKKKPVWIRHVLVPGVTDFDEDLFATRAFIKTLSNVQRVEVLPFHKMGEFKWKELGLPYSLTNTQPPSQERVKNAEEILNGQRDEEI